MKRTLLGAIVALLVIAGAYGISGAATNAPHTDYTPTYGGGCGGSAACHTVNKGAFLPGTLDTTAAPNEKDYTNFCLACHNAAGEAHGKNAGSPSNNVYVNGTGFDQSGTYRGNSHSWKGVNGNAGTRTPVSAGFIKTVNGTDYMVGGTKVACQTCHSSMYKTGANNLDWVQATDTNHGGDHIHYNILGWPNTKQYLMQYLKVYRTASPLDRTTGVVNSRTKNQYLVSPSEYTYKNQSGLLTFSSSQGGNYIYVDIPQPYFRVDNTANAACVDCHNNRDDVDNQVSHEPGTGAKDQHPTGLTYGHSGGLNDTMKQTASSNIYVEGGQVLCTSCHDPHNAASNNGELARNADDSALCGDCHKTKLDGYSTSGSVNNHNGSKHSSATVCLDCHTTHGSNNILLLRNVINGKPVNFRTFSSTGGPYDAFGNGSGAGLCEVCHSGLGQHNADGSGTAHYNNNRCIRCHGHNTGFKPNGDCSSCHGYPPPPAPSGWASLGSNDEHPNHVAHLMATPFNLTLEQTCARCHGGTIPRGDHRTNKDSAGMDTSTWGGGTFSDGGTIGKTNTHDDTCTNVNCHGAGTRTWVAPTGCNGCHGFPPTTAAHSVQYASGIRSHLVSSSDPIYTNITAYGEAGWPCGKCHNNARGAHKNLSVDVAPGGGYGACGGDFTINRTTPGSTVTCSNVKCHTANKTTPNWY